MSKTPKKGTLIRVHRPLIGWEKCVEKHGVLWVVKGPWEHWEGAVLARSLVTGEERQWIPQEFEVAK
jgi:hypothetical protein